MTGKAQDLARRLAERAEAVCRHYLSAGRRQGRYWTVGDISNTPGRSMFVRLQDSPRGPAGKWTDAATGEHGDLLDIIREVLGLVDFKDVAEEARRFLSLPSPEPGEGRPGGHQHPVQAGSPEASHRLFAMAQSIGGSLAEAYLRHRGITSVHGTEALRFHPRCYYRPDDNSPRQIWPAMIASVTDLGGHQTGAHRTWLARDGLDKAPVETPRRAMGDLLGYGVRFGIADDVLIAGEGIETVLSARMALPDMPMLAALSAGHLAAILFPPMLRRLYVLRDRDPAGDSARDYLIGRASGVGIEAIGLSPARGDFNEDLCTARAEALRQGLMDQLRPEDVARFMLE
ncbi:toprim domain-containing protein [Labrys portucalensis]|uniref:Toprim domain-containing protein n=1 Tax=Labrys neptuniae TaxID=376174 RepID=A0ABV6ZP83_9HYPH